MYIIKTASMLPATLLVYIMEWLEEGNRDLAQKEEINWREPYQKDKYIRYKKE